MLIVITLLYPVINYPAVAGLDAICFPTRHASMTRRRLWSCALLAGGAVGAPRGLAWFLPVMGVKFLVSHVVRHEPYG